MCYNIYRKLNKDNIKGEMLMKNLRSQFIELLNIHGTSGNEKPVRDYLKPILANIMDTVKVDDYGNLLADKKCGDGNGATVLLSAHMDTVRGVLADRELIETEDGIIMSNKGALGADDRGGIAIILTVLRNLEKLNFNGHIKVSFSREEEIGCVGAGKIDSKWYEDTDLAIVVDRRGNRDIVAGCGMAFCSDSVGYFMEDVSKMADMDWRCVEGGISDAMVFAENGVNSINLSAGYYNEHTEHEYASLKEMGETVKLILQAIAVINQFYRTFELVPQSNTWSKAWYPKNYSYSGYYEDEFGNDIWIEESDTNGDVYVYNVDGDTILQQGDNEIILSQESLKSIVGQLSDMIWKK